MEHSILLDKRIKRKELAKGYSSRQTFGGENYFSFRISEEASLGVIKVVTHQDVDLGRIENVRLGWTARQLGVKDEILFVTESMEWEQIDIDIELMKNRTVKLPIELTKVSEAIERSRYILNLKKNWDGEGAKDYKQNTWEMAVNYLIEFSKFLLENFGKIIDSPRITHGPDGSIDMLWKNDKYRLLLNIPEEPDSIASFYGDDFARQRVQGTFDVAKKNYGIMATLIEHF